MIDQLTDSMYWKFYLQQSLHLLQWEGFLNAMVISTSRSVFAVPLRCLCLQDKA